MWSCRLRRNLSTNNLGISLRIFYFCMFQTPVTFENAFLYRCSFIEPPKVPQFKIFAVCTSLVSQTRKSQNNPNFFSVSSTKQKLIITMLMLSSGIKSICI